MVCGGYVANRLVQVSGFWVCVCVGLVWIMVVVWVWRVEVCGWGGGVWG